MLKPKKFEIRIISNFASSSPSAHLMQRQSQGEQFLMQFYFLISIMMLTKSPPIHVSGVRTLVSCITTRFYQLNQLAPTT